MKIGSMLSLGAIAAVAVLGTAYLGFGVVNRNGFAEFATATLVLPETGGLGTGSPILLNGIEIGEVSAIDTVAAGVAVRFGIDTDYLVPVNSAVSIETLSALGEPYVRFTPATTEGPYLTDGQTVDTERVQLPHSIPETARLLARVLEQLDPDQVGPLIDTVATAYDGNEAVVPGLARSTDLLAAMITDRAAAVGGTWAELQKIVTDMDWAGPAMSAAGPRFAEFGYRVGDITASVARLFETGDSPRMYVEGDGLVPFLERLTVYIDKAGPDLQPLAPALAPVVDELVGLAPRIDLGGLISQTLDGLDDQGALRVRITVK
jgi:virulence factor Mce-like protein